MLLRLSLFVTACDARLPGGIDCSGAGKTLFILGAFTRIHTAAEFAAVFDLLQEAGPARSAAGAEGTGVLVDTWFRQGVRT